jgi:hypothetical protein
MYLDFIPQKFVLVKRPPFSAAFDAVLRGLFTGHGFEESGR